MGGRSLGWIAAGCLLLPGWVGCVLPRDQHGVILRGDWSLELNRVPWLGCPRPAWRDGCETACAAAPGNSEASSPSPIEAPPVAPEVPDPPAPPAKPAPAQAAQAAGCQGSCLNPLARRPCPIHGARGAHVAQADEHIHSRFSPVPTQPAFYPRTATFQPISGGPFPQVPVQTVAVQGSQVTARPQELPPPQPIRIHTPEPPDDAPAAPLPPRDRETQSPRRVSMAGRGPSLIFAPASNLLAGSPVGGGMAETAGWGGPAR